MKEEERMSKDISEERVWLEMLTSVKRFTHNLGFKTFLNQHLFGRTSFEKIPLSKIITHFPSIGSDDPNVKIWKKLGDLRGTRRGPPGDP